MAEIVRVGVIDRQPVGVSPLALTGCGVELSAAGGELRLPVPRRLRLPFAVVGDGALEDGNGAGSVRRLVSGDGHGRELEHGYVLHSICTDSGSKTRAPGLARRTRTLSRR